jgi:hypothetical protein
MIPKQPPSDGDGSKALKRSRNVYFKEIGGFTEFAATRGKDFKMGTL